MPEPDQSTSNYNTVQSVIFSSTNTNVINIKNLILFYLLFSYFLDVRPKVRSHYKAHKLSLWSHLIPLLHESGRENVSHVHNLFPHHESSHLYSGYVRDIPFKNFTYDPDTWRTSQDTLLNQLNEPVILEHSNSTKPPLVTKTKSEPTVVSIRKVKSPNLPYIKVKYIVIITAVGTTLILINLALCIGLCYYKKCSGKTAKKRQKQLSEKKNEESIVTSRNETPIKTVDSIELNFMDIPNCKFSTIPRQSKRHSCKYSPRRYNGIPPGKRVSFMEPPLVRRKVPSLPNVIIMDDCLVQRKEDDCQL